MSGTDQRETRRLELQSRLDAAKSQADRNRLGQFATPPSLASEVVAAALSLRPPRSKIRFIDPGFGTGSFYSALLNSVAHSRIEAAVGFEIDPHYGEDAKRLWDGTALELHLEDFTKAAPPEADEERFNLVVCNPPYVRHHHLSLDQKRQLRDAVSRRIGYKMNGLSGLYCYFMALSQPWMAIDGTAAWLVPSEFMDVNYGRMVKRFLLEKVTLLHIHRFNPSEVQFGDALVSSAVVFFRNAPPLDDHSVRLSFGGSVTAPTLSETVSAEELRRVPKWTSLPHRRPRPAEGGSGRTLADLFKIKRGLATGCNEFFVVTPEQAEEFEIPVEFLKPILPSPRNLDVDEIPADQSGQPQIRNRGLLIDCHLPEDEVRATYPKFWSYLRSGIDSRIPQRYLCRHREPWYSQENRPPAPFLCTYMGRPSRKNDAPFRFILNHSRATAANVYLLLYPKAPLASILRANADLQRDVWKALSSITAEMLAGQGRIYGGGLHKLEPNELASVSADLILSTIPCGYNRGEFQKELFPV